MTAPLRDQVAEVLDRVVPNTDGVIWNHVHEESGESEPVTIGDLTDVITALVEQRDEERVAVGRCGDEAPTLMLRGEPLPAQHCVLTLGHGGWHKGEDGSEWTHGSHDPHAALVARVQALADEFDRPLIEPTTGERLSRSSMISTHLVRALLSNADTSALEQRDRDVRAGAWEEGWMHGYDLDRGGDGTVPDFLVDRLSKWNPYRPTDERGTDD